MHYILCCIMTFYCWQSIMQSGGTGHPLVKRLLIQCGTCSQHRIVQIQITDINFKSILPKEIDTVHRSCINSYCSLLFINRCFQVTEKKQKLWLFIRPCASGNVQNASVCMSAMDIKKVPEQDTRGSRQINGIRQSGMAEHKANIRSLNCQSLLTANPALISCCSHQIQASLHMTLQQRGPNFS